MNDRTLLHETIAKCAYSLWEEAGHPAQRDEEFWLRAERELALQAGITRKPPIMAPPPVAQSPDPRPVRPRALKRA